MVQKQKNISFKGKVEIIGKSPYAGSGPRGIDVYTRKLSEHISKALPHESLIVSRDQVSSRSVNLVHYTFFDPFFLTLWRKVPRSTPYIVTVHDLIPLRFPEHFPSGIRGKFKYLLQKLALKNSAAIITDSEASREDIAKYIGYSEDRIHVVPLAAGSISATHALRKTIAKEYKLPSSYILYVGDINWNKNIVGLINAFSKIQDDKTTLVLVGKAFAGNIMTRELLAINDAIENSPKKHMIRKLGFVPTHHLSAIYKGAALYVQPSWYEGFGFPVIEALSQGAPVLSSNQGSLPEVGGEHAHYFDPNKKNDLAEKLASLLSNTTLRTKYYESGIAWSKQFNWKNVSKATLSVYEKYAR
ncbi:MAG: glycosyltransferase family 1 protein [Candidatus Moraniibacteriota bacterium]|nr:MAG: glycosyltransferase family 1 protein [Candidatus Moranbacteria bacterium]